MHAIMSNINTDVEVAFWISNGL